MANGSDKDFKVRIVTESAGTGVEETEAKLQALKAEAASAGISPAIAEQLAAAGAKFDPIKGTFVSIAEEAHKAGEATKEIGVHALSAGANLTRARQEAIILTRELATGAPTVRTLSSLLGSLGIPIAIAATAGIFLYKAITSVGEAAKKAAEEHLKLQIQLEEHVRAYEKIRSVAQWDEENAKIEEQISALQRKLAITTDGKETAALKEQLEFLDLQHTELDRLAKLGLERAKAEEKVKEQIKDQAAAINELANAYENARRSADKVGQAAKETREADRKEKDSDTDERRRKGEITVAQALAEKATARREQSAAQHTAEQKAIDDKKKSLQDEASHFDKSADREKKILKGMEDENDHRVKAATAEETLGKAVQKTKEARELEAKLHGPTGHEFPEQARQATEDRKQAEAEEKAARERAAAAPKVEHPGEGKDEFEQNLEKQRANFKKFNDERRKADDESKKYDSEGERKLSDQRYANRERERTQEDRAIANAQKEHDEKAADLKTEDQIQGLKAQGLDLTAEQLKNSSDQRKDERDLVKQGLTGEEAKSEAGRRRQGADQDLARKQQAAANELEEFKTRAAKVGEKPITDAAAVEQYNDIANKFQQKQRDLEQSRQPQELPPVEPQPPPQPGIPPEERPAAPQPQPDTVKTFRPGEPGYDRGPKQEQKIDTSKLEGAADKLSGAAEKLSQGAKDDSGKEIVGLLRQILQNI